MAGILCQTGMYENSIRSFSQFMLPKPDRLLNQVRQLGTENAARIAGVRSAVGAFRVVE
jgi:hypothetical protein